jgi:hypothetical protein
MSFFYETTSAVCIAVTKRTKAVAATCRNSLGC